MAQEPMPSSWVKNLFFAAIILFFRLPARPPTRACRNVLIVMAVLIVAYDFVTNRTTTGRRIYALGGNLKSGAAVRA